MTNISTFLSVLILIFGLTSAQAGTWDCDPETDYPGPISAKACYHGKRVINMDLYGTGYIDETVAWSACSRGKYNVNEVCGKSNAGGEQPEECRIGLIQVCWFCPKEEAKDREDLARLLNVDVGSLDNKCQTIEKTPEAFKKVVLTCPQFIDLSQSLKFKFVDVVQAFENLLFNVEVKTKGTSDVDRTALGLPSPITPPGHQGDVCQWSSIEGTAIEEDVEVPVTGGTPFPNQMVVVTVPEALAYRPGFAEESDYSMEDKDFKAHMFEWTSATKEVIKGKGGFLEKLDGFGYSPTVSKVRGQIVPANELYDRFITLSLSLNQSNFGEWKETGLRLRDMYLKPYLEDVIGFYYKPQKSANEYK